MPFSGPCADATASPTTFGSVREGAHITGFQALSRYLDAAGHPFGARLRHLKTGYTLDLIELQSVPQAFTYVNTFPTSDKGEPHTQEHLLVGKGNKGRMLAESESMTLTGFTAFTMQWRTCYPFNTQAGHPVFYQEFERLLDALLHPDYSDEEIRREVCHFGIAADPGAGTLRLEEKGTVYTEMVSTARQQVSVLYRALFRTVYGPEHPLALNSGGEPAAIREMLPADIRKFHREHYFLGNMGGIVSLPHGEDLCQTLEHLDQILNRLEPEPPGYPVQTEASLPTPQPHPGSAITIYDYPLQNEKQPGMIALAWPPDRYLTPREELLFDLFLDNFSSGATSNLYRLFINSKTRAMDIGAAGVFNYITSEPGHVAVIGIRDVPVANLSSVKIGEVRQAMLDELGRIAAWPDGSPELIEFNTRMQNRIIQSRRHLGKIINSPPGFGFRNGNSFWMHQLDVLNKDPGFHKDLTMSGDYVAIGELIAGTKNIWRERIAAWRLLDVTPYAIATRPNAALLNLEAAERQNRATAEALRLMTVYRAADEQAALQDYRREYEANSAELDRLSSEPSPLKFIDNPPMTLDDQLLYHVLELDGGIPLVASTFENMTSATTGLALRLDGVPESELFLLTLLPNLLTQCGVIRNGKAVSHEEMQELLRQEILGVSASFAVESSTSRAELVVQGSGNDLAESRRALEWMQLVLLHPDWSPANLPRIRDLVEQSLTGFRSSMQGAEERWVRNPIMAYYQQRDPLYLTTSSFLTGAHNVDRLRWMLQDAGTPEDLESIAGFLAWLGANFSRPVLQAVEDGTSEQLAGHTPRVRELAMEVARDLEQLLPDLPESTLLADVRYLCERIARDLAVTPEAALRRLDELRAGLLRTGNARLWMVGSTDSQTALKVEVQSLLGQLQIAPRSVASYARIRRIDQRLREHQPDAADPRFVGLFSPNMQGGVFNAITPASSYRDMDRESLLRYLTRNLFGGGGAHSVFSRTIAAGLAYSNGIGGSLREGTSTYYAERMPDVIQTLHFVIDTIRTGSRDPRLAEYVMAGAFGSNAAGSYETRARAIADDLTDGITPQVVRRFREAILALREDAGLAQELFRRVDEVYGPIIPGYGPKAKEIPGAIYYLIGNDKQFDSLESDVQAREGERVYKLYPRDYWLV
jgi:Zn-dependent M16 (insulinase) family peptidase